MSADAVLTEDAATLRAQFAAVTAENARLTAEVDELHDDRMRVIAERDRLRSAAAHWEDLYHQQRADHGEALKERNRLREALQTLCDLQNGPPLIRRQGAWRDAMTAARAAIEATPAPDVKERAAAIVERARRRVESGEATKLPPDEVLAMFDSLAAPDTSPETTRAADVSPKAETGDMVAVSRATLGRLLDGLRDGPDELNDPRYQTGSAYMSLRALLGGGR